MIWKFEMNIPEQVYEHVQDKFASKILFWIIDSKYRRAVKLTEWIKEQTNNPSDVMKKEVLNIRRGKNHDETMINILKYVSSTITYKSDTSTWSMAEYWQTAEETLAKKTGDCEDGAIYIYVLARLLGVPSNRLTIICGDVNGGGHCWLGYKPLQYPLNYVFLDWCYWVNIRSIGIRPFFYINSYNKIQEYTNSGILIKSNYYTTWFGFNEDKLWKSFKYER